MAVFISKAFGLLAGEPALAPAPLPEGEFGVSDRPVDLRELMLREAGGP